MWVLLAFKLGAKHEILASTEDKAT